MNKRLLLLLYGICFTVLASAQQVLKQSRVNFDLDRKITRLEPVYISLPDSSLLKAGKYVVVFDRSSKAGDIRATLIINDQGKLDGAMRIENPHDHISIAVSFRNGIPISFSKKTQGKLTDSAYRVGDIRYAQEFDSDGHLKTETRYQNGEVIYTRSKTASGLEIEDKLKGTRIVYEGNLMKSRSSAKNLSPGIAKQEESFEKGKLISTQVFYQNGDKKTIHPDGSYDIEGSDAKLRSYSKTGKLLKTTERHYPLGMPHTEN